MKTVSKDDTHDTYKKSATGEEQTPSETDKVFLLSAREVNKYFPQERDRICKASAFAKAQGAEIESGPNQCSWCLRSPAVEMMGLSSWAPSIRADGSGKGWGIYSSEVCARPVIRIKSDKIMTSSITTTESKGRSSNSSTTKQSTTNQQTTNNPSKTTKQATNKVSESTLTDEEKDVVQKA